MRRLFVLTVLIALFVGFGVMIVARPLVPYGPGQDTKAPGKRSSTSKKQKPKPKPKQAVKKKIVLLKRPLRVIALGWEMIASGITANDGARPGKASIYAKKKLTVHYSAKPKMADVESALALGGDDPRGADVAIVSLPEFVAAEERMRALEPRIFLITGWSRGGEALLGKKATILTKGKRGKVKLVGKAGDASTFASLFILKLAGFEGKRVELVGLDDPRAKKATLRAAGWGDERPKTAKVLLTTADASRLVPLVAVTSAGFAKRHAASLQLWSAIRAKGAKALALDVPKAARQLVKAAAAAKDADAPNARDLLSRLSKIEHATLADNARALGLAGRPAVSLQRLYVEVWRAWRATGDLRSNSLPTAPIEPRLVTALVTFEETPAVKRLPPTATLANTEQAVVLRIKLPAKSDDQILARELVLISGVFETLHIRASSGRNIARAERVVKLAKGRYDIKSAERLSVKKSSGGAKPLIVEVLSNR